MLESTWLCAGAVRRHPLVLAARYPLHVDRDRWTDIVPSFESIDELGHLKFARYWQRGTCGTVVAGDAEWGEGL